MERIESPRTDDNAIEKEIQAKGKTAPRVTPDSIKEVIASELYFTAADAAAHVGCPATVAHQLLTFCVLVLKNGFTVTGKSACASPENFDADIGRKVAFGDALNQIWPLEGYLLKQRLFEADLSALTGDILLQHFEEAHQKYVALGAEIQIRGGAKINGLPPYQQRVVTELEELNEKSDKLAAFLVTPSYGRLPDDEQARLSNQLEYMIGYARILSERIAAF